MYTGPNPNARKLLVIGCGGGPALRRIEFEWAQLTHEAQEAELPVWLEAAQTAAKQDNYEYEIIDDAVFLLRPAATTC